ncbi:MAG: iron-containing alcohol dehydrogenase family protein [Negativicutes bacterium]|nr:iron-containing alcohol dehydrogenase family protein [Negativicutes bacterium]
MEDFRFYMPTEIIFGQGCIAKNKQLFARYGKKALIVTYQIPGRHHSLEDVKTVLNELGIEYSICDYIEENPSTETVERVAATAKNIDFIVGIGGGSPVDAAKAVGVLVKNPDKKGVDLFSDAALKSVPILAVPTTAGTGAEVAHFSVLTRNDIQTKQAISPRIFPEIAFLDATYLMGMPERITRATAIDALCHCIESYVSTASSFFSRNIAEIGFRTFSECVRNMKEGTYPYEIREKQLLISTIGGIANTQTGSCLPHGMSYFLTHFKKIPHGLACGLLIKEYLAIFQDRSKIDKIMELTGFENLDAFGEFIDSMLQLDIKVTPAEIEEYAESFASQKHRFTRHPEPAGKEEVLRIFRNSLLK